MNRYPLFGRSIAGFVVLICTLNTAGRIQQSYSHPAIEPAFLDQVNLDSISRTIGDLQSFGTRYDFSQGCKDAALYLFERFQTLGLEVSLEPFQYHAPVLSRVITAPGTSHFWVVGDSGLILHSSDYGNSWEIQQNQLADHLYGLYFYDEMNGWCFGEQGYIYRTVNGGSSWWMASDCMPYANGVFFLNESVGWITAVDMEGWGETIYFTRDGGFTWLPQFHTVGTDLWEMFFTSYDSGFAVGSQGCLARTSDGGQHWELTQVCPCTINLCEMSFTDTKHGWMAGHSVDPDVGYLYRTTDGGLSWEEGGQWEGMLFTGIYFNNPDHGWISDWNGSLLHTKDGGETWQCIETDSTLYNMASPDSGHCIMVSRSNIYRVTSGSQEAEDITPAILPLITSRNVVAVKTGSMVPDSCIIIGAHYDSYSESMYSQAPGADDNASGVAGMMELARLFSLVETKYTLEFVAFAAGEVGLKGSSHYVETALASGKNIKAMINLDRIGFMKSDKWQVWISGDSNSAELADLACELAETFTQLTPHKRLDNRITGDHLYFQAAGLPTLSFTERSNNPYAKTIRDELATLNIAYEGDVIKTVLAVIQSMNENENGSGISSDQSDLSGYRLNPNAPNPFNPDTQISYVIPEPCKVTIAVYTILGKRIHTAVNRSLPPGIHSVTWDGCDDLGHPAPAGIYLCRFTAGRFQESMRMMLMK
jgi:photosystem II stability/assembly factor-like uncharacterized protein